MRANSLVQSHQLCSITNNLAIDLIELVGNAPITQRSLLRGLSALFPVRGELTRGEYVTYHLLQREVCNQQRSVSSNVMFHDDWSSEIQAAQVEIENADFADEL